MDHAKRVDKCIFHALKSIAVGTAAGLLASTLIFRRKRWAFILGFGYGAGSAIAGCDHELFHKEYLDPCEEVKKKRAAQEAKSNKKEDGKAEKLASKDTKKDAKTLGNKANKAKADDAKKKSKSEESKQEGSKDSQSKKKDAKENKS